MKKFLIILSIAIMAGCGGANDGDPKTDTTTMPVDTNLNKTQVNHINRSEGTIIADSANSKDSTFRR